MKVRKGSSLKNLQTNELPKSIKKIVIVIIVARNKKERKKKRRRKININGALSRGS